MSSFKNYVTGAPVDILIIIPPTRHITVPPHLGPGYLASMAKKTGYSVDIIHCDKNRMKVKDVISNVKRINPKVICFSIVSLAYISAKQIISALRLEKNHAPIIIGGPHITVLPEYSLKDLNADFAVVGEGEITFLELLDYLFNNKGALDQIRGLVFRDGNNTYMNEPRELIDNLDQLPFPSWDIMYPNTYPALPHQIIFRRYPVAPLITTRGCSYNCYFCAVPKLWRRRIRTRSPANVVEEMELLIDRYAVKEFHIEDDSFAFDKAHVIDICNEIIRRNLNIIWSLPNGIRADTVTEEVISIMKGAGCYQIGLGFESGNDAVLKKAGKNLNIEMMKNAVAIIKRNKIEVRGFYMIGFPDESKRQIKNTILLSKRLKTDFAVFGICSPIPGSRYFDDCFGNSSYEKIPWRKITYYDGYQSDYLNPSEMKKLLRRCILSYYFINPKNFFRYIKRIRFTQVFSIIKGFLRYMFM